MANIHKDSITTTVADAKAELERILAACRAHICHVGKTNNIENRQYGPPYRFIKVDGTKHEGYIDDIHLIYRTPSQSTCGNAERELIEHARSIIGDFEETEMVLGNARRGGGGRPASSGPYYVYVALGG